MSDSESARSQDVDVWRFVGRAAVTTEFFDADVVGHDQQNVWLGGGRFPDANGRQPKADKK